jgi:predicted permease
LNNLFNLFTENILPIILVAGVGFTLQRLLRLDPRSLSRVIFYAFSPAFVFSLLATTEIEANDILRMAVFALIVIACTIILSWYIARVFRLPPQTTSAFILTAAFMNAGNYGLSLTNFALGKLGLTWASIYFVSSSLVTNSAGIYIATAGRTSPAKALRGLLKVPAIYAIPLALLLRVSEYSLPIPIWRSIDLLGSAAVPSMLILLGMQIAYAGFPKNKGLLAAVIGLKMLIAPIIAWTIAPLMGLDNVSQQAGILESAMPTAVTTTVIATEFDVEPEFVTGVVLATTLLSPFTITPLLAIMGI